MTSITNTSEGENMKTLKNVVVVVALFMLCISPLTSSCFAQSDDKTRVNLPRATAPADDTKGKVELKITVPNVVGKKYPEAKQILESAGYTVKATGQVFSRVSQRTVTSQTPAAGTATTRGAIVTCNIQ
jgi:hypothetical protein